MRATQNAVGRPGFLFLVTSDVEMLWLDPDIADDASLEEKDERPRTTTR
jgi:hypothetical protein